MLKWLSTRTYISIFPDDLTETARKQKQFMTQYLGGPNLYTEEHGHPMMKARHMPFPITPKRAEAWLSCMAEAMDEIGLEGKLRDVYYKRLVLTAHHMVNRNGEGIAVNRYTLMESSISPSATNKAD